MNETKVDIVVNVGTINFVTHGNGNREDKQQTDSRDNDRDYDRRKMPYLPSVSHSHMRLD